MIALVYLSLLSLISVTVWPIFVTTAVLSEVMIKGLFGGAWLAAIPLLIPLALGQLMGAVMVTSGPIIRGTGRPEKELKISALTLPVLVAVLGATSQVSLLAIAWGMFAVGVFRCALMTRAIQKLFDLHSRQFYRAVRGGILMSLACAGAAFTADRFLSDSNITPVVLLILEISLVGIVYILLMLALPKLFIGPYTSDLVRDFVHLLPNKLGTFLVKLLRLETTVP